MGARYMASLLFAILMILISGNKAEAGLFGGNGKGIKGSGDLETRPLDLDEFKEIELGGAFDLEITIGDHQEVIATIDDNLWDNLETEVIQGVLELDWEKSCQPHGKCKIEIVVTRLEKLTINGAGDVAINDFEGDSFDFNLHGAGDLDMDGEVDRLKIRLSGAGDVDTRDLKAKDVNVKISGAGDADVYASGYLQASVSGVGDLTYYGDPDRKQTRVSGVGSIRAR